MSPRFNRWKPGTFSPDELRGKNWPYPDSNTCPECDSPLEDSNTSTYVVACLVELRVSAPTGREDLALREAHLATDFSTCDVVNLNFWVEDQPGSSRCCR